MTATLSVSQQTVVLQVINSLYISGLVLDIFAAMLAFFMARWLERLPEEGKDFLEKEFEKKEENQEQSDLWSNATVSDWLFHRWLGLSLFASMPMLLIGVLCMLVGITVYVWSQQPPPVSIVVSMATATPLIFLIGVICIGREPRRRDMVIRHLSEMRGDW